MVVYQDGTYGLQQMVLLRQFIIAFMHRQVLADLPKKKVLTLIFGKTVVPPLFMHERLVSRATENCTLMKGRDCLVVGVWADRMSKAHPLGVLA